MKGRSRETARRVVGAALLTVLAVAVPVTWCQAGETAVVALPAALRQGRDLLQARRFREAKTLFAAYLRSHPGTVEAEVGLGDAELGLHELEAAETTLRQAVAAQPELWHAHKDLVVVEAGLGRWEEFDRERTVLRMARERGAPGISRQESDVIDRFNAAGGQWIVRSYYQPIGRSQALYNFERFSGEGRVQAYISLEDPVAAEAALTPQDVRIGAASGADAKNVSHQPVVLNWYTGASHGTIRSYPAGAPEYEQLRRDVIHWLERHPVVTANPGSGVKAHQRAEEQTSASGQRP